MTKLTNNPMPRRIYVEKLIPAERAIFAAMEAVEALPADERLTDAVLLLQAARESVGDYVDGIQSRRSVTVAPAGVEKETTDD